MSSESSSRLRQFGLYKTIDSKTAEFLKLSRKRQIKRGCACAAVSTAVTVTVVVGAFLAYEFAFRTDFKTVPKASRHSTWFNADTEAASFDKHNPIKNSGKLLTIILKALDQKRYLEAIVDEYSSDKPFESSSVYQKNVFANARIQKATRYKPPTFTKNRSKDSMEKAKKIMDYHRVMTYLNSMSFTKTTEETARDFSTTLQPSNQEKYRIDKFRQNYENSTTETTLARNVSAKPNITLEKKACCTCSSRSNLTEMLGKLYKSIQQLSPRIIIREPDNAKGNKKSVNKHMTTTVKNDPYKYISKDDKKATRAKFQQTKIPFKTTTRIQTKHTTTTINPKLEIVSYKYNSVFNIDRVKNSTIAQNETTLNLDVSSRMSYENKTSNKEELAPPKEILATRKEILATRKELLAPRKEILGNWKLDFTDVVYDDTANDNAQTEYSVTDSNPPTVTDVTSRNNNTNKNNPVSDITVTYTPYTTPHNVQSNFDDKIEDLPTESVQIPLHAYTERKEIEKTPLDTEFVNYLSSFNQLQSLIFNKPQTPETSKENPQLEKWNFENFLTDEEADPLKLVSYPSEKQRTQVSIEEFHEKHSPNAKGKSVVLELGSGSFINENDKNPISTTENTLERVENTVDEKLPLTPMMQKFLFSKKESGLILNLDETTTMSIKLQTDSVGDLPFNVSFYEDYEDSSNLKTTSTSTVTPAKEAHKHGISIDDHATSLKKYTTTHSDEAQQHIHTIIDEDASTLRTNTITSKRDENVRSLKTTKRIFKDLAKKQDINRDESTLKTHTKASAKVAQQEQIDNDEIVSSLETPTTASTNETQQDDANTNNNVVLLVYEYALVEETHSLQNNYNYGNYSYNETADAPVADRLGVGRSYLGFDQDYYERMPLLVNAMQENHYVDPLLETGILRPDKKERFLRNSTKLKTPTSIRRTSPRPFIFELRSPTPTPFSKTFGSKSWVESYRNAQRLENLQQVIEYLETTINAKFGDLHELPSSPSTHIAFSGVYVKPSATDKEAKPTSPTLDLLLKSSSNKKETKSNHMPDPLFSFKPDNPGDVNLLADGFLRFAPTPTLVKDKPTIPMFRPISNLKKQDNADKNVIDAQASEIKNIETSTVDKPNSFSVMLNYVPTKTTIDYSSSDGTSSAINKVYFTTARPVKFQFKRRFNGPVKRIFMPRTLNKPIINTSNILHRRNFSRKANSNTEATMIVHVNVYPQRTVTKEVDESSEKQDYTTTPMTTTTQVYKDRPLTQAPELSLTQVEDHHMGSSGVIPIEHRTVPPAPPPPVTPSIPFETTVSSTTDIYSWPTNPPDVVKFSHEDAKVPDHYHGLREKESSYYTTEVNSPKYSFNNKYKPFEHVRVNSNPVDLRMRNFNSDVTETQSTERFEEKDDYMNEYIKFLESRRSFTRSPTGTNRRNDKDEHDNKETVEPSTLVVKLKNEEKLETTTNTTISEEEDSDETTTVQTYVPQINGHYRSVTQNSKAINNWFDEDNDNEHYRKRILENKMIGLNNTSYVEIKRNNTNINKYDEDYESDE